MKIIRLLFLGLFFSGLHLVVAQPTDNAYRSFYHPAGFHWTDSLRWDNVFVATAHGISPSTDSVTNIQNLRTLVATVHNNGGGVIFFPAGEYHFSDSLDLKSGVILRGETPAITRAKDSLFRPASKLVFPRYIPTFSGTGTPNQTAFKRITCEANASNFGVVNLDINRGKIHFMPIQYYHQPNPKGTGGWPGGVVLNGVPGTYLPVDQPSNLIVFGMRQNNIAFPEPSVPTSTQNQWQRWSYRFASNIDVNVSRNAVISNNRLNDKTTDNFNQPGYTAAGPCGTLAADGSQTVFNYTNHYGITVNRVKIQAYVGSGLNSQVKLIGNLLYSYPEDEPYLYAPGNEVNDNWIFKTMRVALYVAGNGLQVRRNESHDIKNKPNYLLPQGNNCNVGGSTTYENRGIDFAGWNLTIDSNNLEMYNARIKDGPYYSPDGEFVLLQECCGGTPVNNYKFTNNVGNSYIGLYKVRDITNTIISNNKATPPISNFPQGIFVDANVYTAGAPGNIAPYTVANTLIENNTTTLGLLVTGAKRGSNVIVRNNTSLDNKPITASCYVQVENNNTGFSGIQWKSLDTDQNTTAACPEATDLPTVGLASPGRDTLIEFAQLQPTFPLAVDYKKGNVQNQKVSIYVNGTKVLSKIPFSDPADTTVYYTWAIPQIPNRTYFITGEVVDTVSGIHDFTIPVKVGVGIVSTKEKEKNLALWDIYPNPSKGEVWFRSFDKSGGTLRVTDIQGREIFRQPVELASTYVKLKSGNLPKGLYLVQFLSGKRMSTRKLILE